jgi:hypothetical protein
MEAVSNSETTVNFHETTRHNISEKQSSFVAWFFGELWRFCAIYQLFSFLTILLQYSVPLTSTFSTSLGISDPRGFLHSLIGSDAQHVPYFCESRMLPTVLTRFRHWPCPPADESVKHTLNPRYPEWTPTFLGLVLKFCMHLPSLVRPNFPPISPSLNLLP